MTMKVLAVWVLLGWAALGMAVETGGNPVQRIVFPAVDFQGATPEAVAGFIAVQAKRCDPAGQGVAVRLTPGRRPASEFSLRAAKVPLAALLYEFCTATGLAYRYEADGNCLIISSPAALLVPELPELPERPERPEKKPAAPETVRMPRRRRAETASLLDWKQLRQRGHSEFRLTPALADRLARLRVEQMVFEAAPPAEVTAALNTCFAAGLGRHKLEVELFMDPGDIERLPLFSGRYERSNGAALLDDFCTATGLSAEQANEVFGNIPEELIRLTPTREAAEKLALRRESGRPERIAVNPPLPPALEAKLRGIFIPRIHLTETPFAAGLAFLNEEVGRCDPWGEGVPVRAELPDAEAAKLPKLNLLMVRQSAFEMLDYFCRAAGMVYRAQDGAVVLSPDEIRSDRK